MSTVVIELTRSLHTWAARVVFVNAHGGNVPALRRAVTQLVDEGDDVAWFPCATEDVDAHAGYTEALLMLHLRPWDVRLHRAEARNTTPLADLLPQLMTLGVGAVAPNGVLGYPAGASAEEGRQQLALMAQQIAAQLVRPRSPQASRCGSPRWPVPHAGSARPPCAASPARGTPS